MDKTSYQLKTDTRVPRGKATVKILLDKKRQQFDYFINLENLLGNLSYFHD